MIVGKSAAYPSRCSGQPSAVQASGQAGPGDRQQWVGDEMPRGTLASVLRQAGIKRGKR